MKFVLALSRILGKRDPHAQLAHVFGRLADYVRGHPVSITAIEREEAAQRAIQERRRRRERSGAWMEARGLRFRPDWTVTRRAPAARQTQLFKP